MSVMSRWVRSPRRLGPCAALVVSAALGACTSPGTSATGAPRAAASIYPAPVILISLDGFRNAYIDSFPTPNIRRLAKEGVRAKGMYPVHPTTTFPNHYTLVTGWYAGDHGIFGSSAYDSATQLEVTMNSDVPDFPWPGEPIWVTAAKHGVKSATMFWPASNSEIHGHRPTYWIPYRPQEWPNERRVRQILKWLDLPPADRPRFLTLYYSDVDGSGAKGPWSAINRAAVAHVDSMVGLLLRGLEERKIYDSVNVIVVADHGMVEFKAVEQRVVLSDVLDTNTIVTDDGMELMWLRAKNGDQAGLLATLRRLPHVRVYPRDSIPEYLHLRNYRGALPILMIADEGWTIWKGRIARLEQAWGGKEMGTHGLDPSYESMHVPFVARGPGFTSGATLPMFENVNVYPLLAHLLGVPPAPSSGNLRGFANVLTQGASPASAAR